ncbi:hypothetical protein BGY98DRAFT_1014131 [Russula aff. rugulosa BPL654]|nr:hypothetical protein BGY98DRAFT_1014131 [Russula aff. rugulosa BPL654]
MHTMLGSLFFPLSLLAVLFVFTTAALSESVTLRRDLGVREKGVNDLHFLPPRGHSTTDDDPLEILNVVLVASVDGKFHALNRTTGGKLWSMPSSPPPRASPSSSDHEVVQPVPSILGPLVSTKHLDVDPDIDDDPFSQETYIVEPQSEGDGRVFVGRKKTSILLIELETGHVMDVDLDELEGLKSLQQRPHEVLIGRTDYHISILSHPPSRPSRPIPIQHLSFSTYGPNNQDLQRQAAYHRSVDQLYLEPLPNGEVISFKVQDDIDPTASVPENKALWGQRFLNPIVAVFDVVKSSRKPSPFVLLQPRLRLQDILPSAIHQRDYSGDETAFVGLVPGTDSLFALSPGHFPLHGTLQCFEGTTDRQCLTGVRALRADSLSRLARLLDGVPGPPSSHLPSTTSDPTRSENTNSQVYADSEPLIVPGEAEPPWEWLASLPESLSQNQNSWAHSNSGLLLALASVVGSLLWFNRKAPPNGHNATVRMSAGSVPRHLVRKTPADGNGGLIAPLARTNDSTDMAPLELQAGEIRQSANDTFFAPNPTVTHETPETPNTASVTAPNTPMPPSLTDVDIKGSPVKPEFQEGAEDVGEVKKKRKRRRRRKGEPKDAAAEGGEEPDNEDGEGGEDGTAVPPGTPSSGVPSMQVPPASSSLVVSDTVLGYGSHGTVVYVGSLQGRAVAVKRLLQDFVTLAHREVSLLKDADDHPNVIRYYYQEAHGTFLYIALELCPASLAEIIERPDQFREIAVSFSPKRAVRQITSGLRHLHALKIVHRDIKPQNILISGAKKGESGGHRMLISDFGLCRKLELDQTSFLPTTGGAMGVGTFGWRAPEILRGEVKLDVTVADDNSQGSHDSVGTATGSNHSGTGRPTTRLTKSVDIFALGCLYYYCLTNGGHPFGDRFEREVNIIRDQKSLEGLEGFGEEGLEAVDLISSMLAPEAADRPDTTTCLMHPYFWDAGRRLGFLQDASDRFEIMCRDPRDPHLILLEDNAINVVGPDWPARLDKVFVENLGKFRKYDGRSVQDLLRALRNKVRV